MFYISNLNIGKLLKILRQTKKLSLRDAGDLSGISHTYISAIEKNKRPGSNTPINPTPETLKRLAQAYEYPYELLLKEAGYIDEEQKINNNTYDSLSEINKLVKKYGIEQMGFFDIEEWKNLSPDDVRLVEEHFKMIVKLAKERNDKEV